MNKMPIDQAWNVIANVLLKQPFELANYDQAGVLVAASNAIKELVETTLAQNAKAQEAVASALAATPKDEPKLVPKTAS